MKNSFDEEVGGGKTPVTRGMTGKQDGTNKRHEL
jgi:hypothetical protein